MDHLAQARPVERGTTLGGELEQAHKVDRVEHAVRDLLPLDHVQDGRRVRLTDHDHRDPTDQRVHRHCPLARVVDRADQQRATVCGVPEALPHPLSHRHQLADGQPRSQPGRQDTLRPSRRARGVEHRRAADLVGRLVGIGCGQRVLVRVEPPAIGAVAELQPQRQLGESCAASHATSA